MEARMTERRVATPQWARLTVAGLRAVVAALSPPARRCLGRALGWMWYRLVPVRRSVARAQVASRLVLSREETERVVREMYLRLGARVVEVFGPAPRWRVHGLEAVEAQVPQGQGIIFVTAHLGQFERLADAGLWRRRVHVITSRFSVGPLQTLWAACREGRVTPLVQPGANGRALRATLERGDALAFMLDQHASAHSAVQVECLGAPAWTSTAPARLAISSGAPLVVVYTAQGVDLESEAVIVGPTLWPDPTLSRAASVRDLTQRAVAALDEAIRSNPADWLWIHRRWKHGGDRAQRLEERRRVRMTRLEPKDSRPSETSPVDAPYARCRDAQVEPCAHLEGPRDDVGLEEREGG